MESARPQTLAEYAYAVLKDERVEIILQSIRLSNEMADALINSVRTDMGTEEFLYAMHYREALREAKRSSLRKIIDEAMPWRWMPGTESIEQIVQGIEKPGEPTLGELPLVTFFAFLFDPDFLPFLLEGTLPWLKTPLPEENKILFVFGLFLWLKMDGRYEPVKRITYYVAAIEEGKKNLSTIESRIAFIELFGKYIHTDLWTAADYVRQGKEGTVMRLRMTDYQSGRVVLQACGEVMPECNRLYLVTGLMMEDINQRYVKTGLLVAVSRKENIFQCYKCGCVDACLFHPSNKLRFYCKEDCYYTDKLDE